MRSMRKRFTEKHPAISGLLSVFIYFVSLIAPDLALRKIHVAADSSPFGGEVPFLYTVCWCLILSAIALILPKLARKIFTIATTSFFALMVLVHEFFYSFFGSYMSFSSVVFAETGAGFFDWSYFSISKKVILILIASVVLSSSFPKPITPF